MPRFKLTIEYAGTRYSGWQIQKNARTVQGEIDGAVRTVTGRTDFELYGSGRTDAGVHALAQVAHLDVSTHLPADTLRRRLNDELPADINILGAAQVPHRFHARHHAVARRYLYQIARRRTAFAKPYVWWVKEPLDVERMREAARAFVGMRDFRSFAAWSVSDGYEHAPSRPAPPKDGRNSQAVRREARLRGAREPVGRPAPRDARDEPDDTPPSTLVLVDHLEIIEDGDLLLVSIQGSHFLWKMVRRMVGVLVEIGRGELSSDAVRTFLAEGSSAPARLTAPPSGLFLEHVYYQGDPQDAPPRAATPLPSSLTTKS